MYILQKVFYIFFCFSNIGVYFKNFKKSSVQGAFRCDMTSSKLERTHETDRRLDRAPCKNRNVRSWEVSSHFCTETNVPYIHFLYHRDDVDELCKLISLATRTQIQRPLSFPEFHVVYT
jgi:hypothetical protein